MAESQTESADADADEEQFAWATQTPTTRVVGQPEGIIYAGRLDSSVAQNDTSFGLILSDVDVVTGEAWVNQEKPDDGTTADGVDDDQSRPTDYRIADSDHERTTIANGALVTGENGPNTYDEAEAVSEDTVILWYNGLTGQRISRVLDFNGRPFARWTDDDYLVKGLYQAAEGWRGANGDKRAQMADNGKAPRVVRPPILRQRVEVTENDEGNVEDATLLEEAADQRIMISMSTAPSGRGYRAHVFDADDFEDEFGSLDADATNDAGYVEADSELDMPYTPAADQILEEAEYRMNMHTGDGWQNEPSSWEPQSTSEVSSFGVAADSGTDSDDEEPDGLTAEQEQFVREVVDNLKGTGMTPDEAFDGGVEGLIGKYSDDFQRVPDADMIREEVYGRVAHLDPDDLDE